MDTVHAPQMSSYTTVEVRAMIDDIDEKLRMAVMSGDVEKVFAKERAVVVSKTFITLIDNI